ncbi:MAG TPA: ABC transporter substrate binding protein [Elusimicrobiales bacterium]|nr:ABC transporter substrate binding protein [Elusimicrobiales bacterium]
MPGIISLVLACALSVTLLSQARAAEAPQQKLFIVFSYPAGQWSEGILTGLSTRLARSGIRYTLKHDIYDSPRFSPATSTEAVAEAVRIVKAAAEYRPDFVILCDDEGADALAPGMKKLGIPLLFAGINKDEKDVAWLEKGINLTGVFERYPIEPSLKLLSNLSGGKVKTISLLTSINPTSVIIEKQFSDYFRAHKTRVALKKSHATNKWSDWQRAILDINSEGEALWLLVPWNVEDAEGERMDLRVMGKWMSANIRVPSISIVDVNLQLGAMASISMTPEIMGEELGNIIHLSVSEHRPLSNIPYRYPSKHEIIINKKQTDRLGVKVPIELLEYAKIIKQEGLDSDQ